MIELLGEEGAEVSYYDPWIASYKYKGEIHNGLEKLTEKQIAQSDLVLIATAHSNFDYDMINKNAKAIFDTRNAMKNIKDRSKIEVL